MVDLVVDLVEAAVSLITPQTWKEVVQHAEKTQDEDNRQDTLAKNFVESFVIIITECSDEDENRALNRLKHKIN